MKSANKHGTAKQRLKSSNGNGFRDIFPKLTRPGKRFGVGVFLSMARRQGGNTELRYATIEVANTLPGERPKSNLLAKADAKKVADMLTGLSHPDRVRVATAIVTGSNTHRLLKEAMGIKAGPLYHHLRELQMAGLVSQPARNQYELSELGESALFMATGLASSWKRRQIPCGDARNVK